MKYQMINEKIRSLNKHFEHPSYSLERKLHSEVKNGMLEEALKSQQEFLSMERPMLATDKLRSLKNSFICSCTLFTRSAIDAGVDPDDAFYLSDACIKNIETFTDCDKLEQFEKKILTDFIKLINKTRANKYKTPISDIVMYIYENTTKKLTVASIAEYTHLSKDYLSKLFYKVVGIHLTDYILMQKVEMSKNFLEHTDMKITDIAVLFEFCNQGYYSKVFKKYTDTTPYMYRRNSH